jgi:ketosteroid isomerase-like protein
MEETARRFHERQLDDPPERIAALMCEDAEMKLLVHHLKPLRGRQAIMSALAEGREADLYSAEVDRCEQLDEDTLLVCGQARYALEDGGVAHSSVWWVDRFRDGQIWQVEAFISEDAARAGSAPDRHSRLDPSVEPSAVVAIG